MSNQTIVALPNSFEDFEQVKQVLNTLITSVDVLYGFRAPERFAPVPSEDSEETATPAESSAQVDHWNAAYGWGNHALMGYVTETELEARLNALLWADFNAIDQELAKLPQDNWNAAYSWGNHALMGYANHKQIAARVAIRV